MSHYLDVLDFSIIYLKPFSVFTGFQMTPGDIEKLKLYLKNIESHRFSSTLSSDCTTSDNTTTTSGMITPLYNHIQHWFLLELKMVKIN